jgi:hypothetical protein
MKTVNPLNTILFLVIICLAANLYAQSYYNNPESVVYDAANDRYLVSNKGDGKIIAVDKEENQTLFNTDQKSIRGLHILGDKVFAGCDTGVVAFNLADGTRAFVIDIPEKVLLNDVTSDSDGNLYISDSSGDQIFKVNPTDKTYTILATGILGTNGLWYDSIEDRLFTTTAGITPSISAVDLSDGTVTQIVVTPHMALDGLTEDNEGNIYYSSWQFGAVYRYDRAFSQDPVLVSSGHTGPADIGYNLVDNVLAIPEFLDNEVIFLDMGSTSVGSSKMVPKGYILGQNFPNPFNPLTTIQYSLSKSRLIKLDVFNSIGQHIRTLTNSYHAAGNYQIIWDGKNDSGKNMSSGIYLYGIMNGESNQMVKMHLLR